MIHSIISVKIHEKNKLYKNLQNLIKLFNSWKIENILFIIILFKPMFWLGKKICQFFRSWTFYEHKSIKYKNVHF